jgi:hypothetical protein
MREYVGGSMTEREAHGGESWRPHPVLWGLALVYFVLLYLPGITGPYTYFIDELYYLPCADHLAFGFVDHPPLSILILKVIRTLAGDSLPVLRLFPALCGAATILVVGLTARRLGAGLYGQALAAGAAMTGPIWQVMFSFYSMNSLDNLLWALTFLVLVELERQGEPRLWLAVGLLAGLALENKHTYILLLFGLGAALLLTRARHHLRSRWLWIGVAVAVLILLPNILWQVASGWPSLEFYRNANLHKNVQTPPLEVLVQQLLFNNPVAALVWVPGLVFLLGAERGRPWRHLGWLFVALLVVMLIGQKSRPDRIAGAFAILFAGGGAALCHWTRERLRWLRYTLPLVLIAGGLFLVPLGLPLLPPEAAAEYGAKLGIVPQIEAGKGKRAELPQWLADRLGWEQLADDVEQAVKLLGPEERRTAVIIAPSYGQAGAVELHGRGRDLPPVYGMQNSRWHWGPPPDASTAAIFVGFRRETVEALFEEVEQAGFHDCDWCMAWRDETPLWLGRRMKVAWSEVWPEFRYYE